MLWGNWTRTEKKKIELEDAPTPEQVEEASPQLALPPDIGEEEPPHPAEETPQENVVTSEAPSAMEENAGEEDKRPTDMTSGTDSEIEIHPHTHDVRKDWLEFIDYVKERKIWMAQDLQLADTAKEIEGELHLHYSDPTICTLLKRRENRKLLTEFVLDYFQKDLTVRFITPEINGNGVDNGDPESPHKQRQKLARDPLVQMAVEIFSGQVGDIRIGPRSR